MSKRSLTPTDYEVVSIARSCDDRAKGNTCIIDGDLMGATCYSTCVDDFCNSDLRRPEWRHFNLEHTLSSDEGSDVRRQGIEKVDHRYKPATQFKVGSDHSSAAELENESDLSYKSATELQMESDQSYKSAVELDKKSAQSYKTAAELRKESGHRHKSAAELENESDHSYKSAAELDKESGHRHKSAAELENESDHSYKSAAELENESDLTDKFDAAISKEPDHKYKSLAALEKVSDHIYKSLQSRGAFKESDSYEKRLELIDPQPIISSLSLQSDGNAYEQQVNDVKDPTVEVRQSWSDLNAIKTPEFSSSIEKLTTTSSAFGRAPSLKYVIIQCATYLLYSSTALA